MSPRRRRLPVAPRSPRERLSVVPRVPAGQTAQRLTWRFLPSAVRDAVEERLGSPVLIALSQDSGFTPGFASLLAAESGTRVFVKAASRKAQGRFAESYAVEAHNLALLGAQVPSPKLLWQLEVEDWLVLGIEAVEATTPQRPWDLSELTRALDLANEISIATVDLPDGLELASVIDDSPDLLTGWGEVDDDWPHLTDLIELTKAFAELPMDRFVHLDLRDDNILLCSDGRTLACDWNWPALGPVWFDVLGLLVMAYGDGLDAEALLATHPLSRDVPDEHIDAGIAAICGFMMASRQRPVPSQSPYLRMHANWWAEASWAWLCDRRGWVADQI